MQYVFSEAFAREMDEKDPLKDLRAEYLFPQHEGRDVLYFCGNSLGLQPKGAEASLKMELEDWAKHGVEGHFNARRPWYAYHEFFAESLAKIVGATPKEVVAMNGLTTNIHVMLATFYRPHGVRKKILCEAKAFPSDQYALSTQAELHGLDPKEVIVEVVPREGEHLIRHEDILQKIAELGDELALVMLGGVNYYSGQVFDMKGITAAAHQAGALVGFDLAHAVGNIELHLHDWQVDVAMWCSYKYMNSGPGGVAGVFVHEKHAQNTTLPRFGGWWGHDKEERFKMEPDFRPIPTAEGWQLSNAPVFSMAVHRAALDLFDRTSMKELRTKSELLTGYFEFVVEQVSQRNEGKDFEIITPREKEQRGGQISILAHGTGRALYDKLMAQGVVVDFREPNVIRTATAPMYNSFMDVFRFGEALELALKN